MCGLLNDSSNRSTKLKFRGYLILKVDAVSHWLKPQIRHPLRAQKAQLEHDFPCLYATNGQVVQLKKRGTIFLALLLPG